MYFYVVTGLLLPFVGTALGSGCALAMKNKLSANLNTALNGFAAGVMMAASVWSLLIPAINRCESMGSFSFVPAVFGLGLGVLFLFGVDKADIKLADSLKNHSLPEKTAMLVLAVTIHNLPEGMAVGAIFSALLAGEQGVSLGGALSLALGIAIQNFPEGAIISMPLKANGIKKSKAFVLGVLSGVVEPLGAFVTIVLSAFIVPLLPCFLGFAAGAMIYVVVSELIPGSDNRSRCTAFFALGFSVMMMLDVALG